MACICWMCHGKGKHTYPIYTTCDEHDEGAISILGKFIKIIGEKEVECQSCNGTGIMSASPTLDGHVRY